MEREIVRRPELPPVDPVNRLSEAAKGVLQKKFEGISVEGTRATFNFVNQIHAGEKNAEVAFEAAKEADVICYEWTGLPHEEKEKLALYLNQNAQGTLSAEVRTTLIEWLRREERNEPHYLMIKFFEELQGSGKAFVLVDTYEEDSTDQILSTAESNSYYAMLEAVYNGEPLTEVREKALKAREAGATAMGYRDKVVASQLGEIDSLLIGKDAKVGVFVGIEHTGSYHQADKDGLQLTRQFVPQDTTPGVLVRYSHEDQAERTMLFTSGDTPQGIVDKGIVEACITKGKYGSRKFRELLRSDYGYLAKKLDVIDDEKIEESLHGVIALARQSKGSSVKKAEKKAGDYLVKNLKLDLAA